MFLSMGRCEHYKSYKGNFKMSDTIISLCHLLPSTCFSCFLAVFSLMLQSMCVCVWVPVLEWLLSYLF